MELHEVVTKLAALGVPATVEYPGFIAVPVGQKVWNFGTANEWWGGELTDANGEQWAVAEFEGLPSDTADAEGVANAIWELVR